MQYIQPDKDGQCNAHQRNCFYLIKPSEQDWENSEIGVCVLLVIHESLVNARLKHGKFMQIV